jgi:PhnB protein
MAKRSLSLQLDDFVQATLSGPVSAASARQGARVDERIAPLLVMINELRGLPHEDFKASLRSDLTRRASVSTATASAATSQFREGFHSITPYLMVPKAAGLIDFLKQAFAAEEIFRVNRPDGLIMHAQLKIDDSMIELADAWADYPARATALHLYVRDADAVYQRALQAGATSLQQPTDQPYGDREAGVRDAFGNTWYIATNQATGHAPAGLRAVTPYLHLQDAPQIIGFLKNAFGAEELERALSPDGTIVHAKVRIGDSVVEMSEARAEYPPNPCALHLYVSDTDALYEHALGAGAISISAPADQPYGDRGAGVKDPAGNQWYIATYIKDVPL